MRCAKLSWVSTFAIVSCYDGGSGGGDSTSTSTSNGSVTLDASVDDPSSVDDASTSPTVTMTTPGTTTEGTGSVDTTAASADTGPATESSSTDDGGTTGPEPPPCSYDPVDGTPGFDLQVVAEGLDTPLFAIGHPTEPDRLFVLEMDGNLMMFEPGSTAAVDPPLLQIDVSSGGERGLLGLAFHPEFPNDPRIYVNYTAPGDGRTRIEEYALDPANGFVGDPDSARLILDLYQPETNHNGGGIAFVDGQLIIGMGDGGTSVTSRNPEVLMSKFLRIGVEPDGTLDDPIACAGCPVFGPFDYTVPDDNPFVGRRGYAPEIFAMGFRNPWRWSVDPPSGRIYVGDVGQGAWEEIDEVAAGRDYGWVDMEGFHCNADGSCDDSPGPHEENADGLTMPLIDFPNSEEGCAVIGGAVYRSCEVPEWDGIYLYSDYCNSDIRGLRWDGVTVEDLGVVLVPPLGFLGNGWNAWGDVYFTGGLGQVFRIVPAA